MGVSFARDECRYVVSNGQAKKPPRKRSQCQIGLREAGRTDRSGDLDYTRLQGYLFSYAYARMHGNFSCMNVRKSLP